MTEATVTQADFDRAAKETERLQSELDITNADHIALWIEANLIPDEPMSQCVSWFACRIAEAYERTAASQASDAGERIAMTDLTNHLIGYTIDWNGSPMSDEAPTLTDVSCGLMRKAAARIEALEGTLSRLLEWWPEGSEAGRLGRGDAFVCDLQSARAILAQQGGEDG